MLGIISSGLRGVAGIGRALVSGAADTARVSGEVALASLSTPIAHGLAAAHGAGARILTNSSGQVIQMAAASPAAAAASSAGLSLPAPSIPSGGEALGGLAVPAAGGGAGALGGSMSSAASAGPAQAAQSTPTDYLGVIHPQGMLPLPPQGVMRHT